MKIFDRICRGCNNERTNFKNIFEDKTLCSTMSIYEMLRYCSQMEVDIDDKYPKKICTLCARQLEISYKFIIQYKKSIQQFDEMFAYLAQPRKDAVQTVEVTALNESNIELNLKSIVKEQENLVEDCVDIQNKKDFLVEELDNKDAPCVNCNDNYLDMLVEDNNDEVYATSVEKESTTTQNEEYFMGEQEICLSTNKNETEEMVTVVKKKNPTAYFNFPSEKNSKEVKSNHIMFSKIKTENQKRTFSCPECQISFYTCSALSLHQKIKHRSKKLMQVDLQKVCKTNVNYGCNVCLKTFSSRVKLSLHLKKHSN